MKSAPDLIPNTELESGRFDSELPPLVETNRSVSSELVGSGRLSWKTETAVSVKACDEFGVLHFYPLQRMDVEEPIYDPSLMAIHFIGSIHCSIEVVGTLLGFGSCPVSLKKYDVQKGCPRSVLFCPKMYRYKRSLHPCDRYTHN